MKPRLAEISLFSIVYAFLIIASLYPALRMHFMMPRALIYALVALVLTRPLFASNWNRAVIVATVFYFVAGLIYGLQYLGMIVLDHHWIGLCTPDFAHIVRFYWPVDILVIIFGWWAGRNWSGIFLDSVDEIIDQKDFIVLVLMVLIQFSLVCGAIMEFVQNASRDTTELHVYLVMACFAFFFLSSLYIINKSLRQVGRLVMKQLEAGINESVQQLLTTVATHRHDFLHHVQMLNIMTAGNQTEKALEYLDGLNRELLVIQDVLRLGSPFMSALVHAKRLEADQRGIRFEISIIGSEEAWAGNSPVLNATRVLSIAISNALDAVSQLPQEQRLVCMEARRKGKLMEFTLDYDMPVDVNLQKNAGEGRKAVINQDMRMVREDMAGRLCRKTGGTLETAYLSDMKVHQVISLSG